MPDFRAKDDTTQASSQLTRSSSREEVHRGVAPASSQVVSQPAILELGVQFKQELAQTSADFRAAHDELCLAHNTAVEALDLQMREGMSLLESRCDDDLVTHRTALEELAAEVRHEMANVSECHMSAHTEQLDAQRATVDAMDGQVREEFARLFAQQDGLCNANEMAVAELGSRLRAEIAQVSEFHMAAHDEHLTAHESTVEAMDGRVQDEFSRLFTQQEDLRASHQAALDATALQLRQEMANVERPAAILDGRMREEFARVFSGQEESHRLQEAALADVAAQLRHEFVSGLQAMETARPLEDLELSGSVQLAGLANAVVELREEVALVSEVKEAIDARLQEEFVRLFANQSMMQGSQEAALSELAAQLRQEISSSCQAPTYVQVSEAPTHGSSEQLSLTELFLQLRDEVGQAQATQAEQLHSHALSVEQEVVRVLARQDTIEAAHAERINTHESTMTAMDTRVQDQLAKLFAQQGEIRGSQQLALAELEARVHQDLTFSAIRAAAVQDDPCRGTLPAASPPESGIVELTAQLQDVAQTLAEHADSTQESLVRLFANQDMMQGSQEEAMAEMAAHLRQEIGASSPPRASDAGPTPRTEHVRSLAQLVAQLRQEISQAKAKVAEVDSLQLHASTVQGKLETVQQEFVRLFAQQDLMEGCMQQDSANFAAQQRAALEELAEGLREEVRSEMSTLSLAPQVAELVGQLRQEFGQATSAQAEEVQAHAATVKEELAAVQQEFTRLFTQQDSMEESMQQDSAHFISQQERFREAQAVSLEAMKLELRQDYKKLHTEHLSALQATAGGKDGEVRAELNRLYAQQEELSAAHAASLNDVRAELRICETRPGEFEAASTAALEAMEDRLRGELAKASVEALKDLLSGHRRSIEALGNELRNELRDELWDEMRQEIGQRQAAIEGQVKKEIGDRQSEAETPFRQEVSQLKQDMARIRGEVAAVERQTPKGTLVDQSSHVLGIALAEELRESLSALGARCAVLEAAKARQGPSVATGIGAAQPDAAVKESLENLGGRLIVLGSKVGGLEKAASGLEKELGAQSARVAKTTRTARGQPSLQEVSNRLTEQSARLDAQEMALRSSSLSPLDHGAHSITPVSSALRDTEVSRLQDPQVAILVEQVARLEEEVLEVSAARTEASSGQVDILEVVTGRIKAEDGILRGKLQQLAARVDSHEQAGRQEVQRLSAQLGAHEHRLELALSTRQPLAILERKIGQVEQDVEGMRAGAGATKTQRTLDGPQTRALAEEAYRRIAEAHFRFQTEATEIRGLVERQRDEVDEELRHFRTDIDALRPMQWI